MRYPGGVMPMLDITLPAPIILPTPFLVVIHWMLMSLDFLLLRNEHRMPLTKVQLRIALGFFHALVPVIVVCPSAAANLFLAALPWYYVAYTASLPLDKFSYQEWLESFNYVVLDMGDNIRWSLSHKTAAWKGLPMPKNVRRKGAIRVGRGVAKLMVMKLWVDRFLPQNYAAVLALEWYHPLSLVYTVLFVTKAYCFLGVADIGMGIQQVIVNVPQVDLFDYPFLATSPVDFWSRRWNRVIRNLFHHLLFMNAPRRSLKVRGILVFLISGVFHELLIMSLCRRVSSENLLFFAIHGLAVLVQVSSRRKRKPATHLQGVWKCLAVMGNMLFFSVTGRMFLAPYLRCFAS